MTWLITNQVSSGGTINQLNLKNWVKTKKKEKPICLRNEGCWPRRIGGRSRAEDQKRPSEEASQGRASGGGEAMDGREPAKKKQEEKKKTKMKVRTRMGDEEAMGPARLSHPKLGEGLSLALRRSTEPRLWRGLGGVQCFPSRGSSKLGSRRRRSASSGRARGAAAGSLPRGQSWEFHSFLLFQREFQIDLGKFYVNEMKSLALIHEWDSDLQQRRQGVESLLKPAAGDMPAGEMAGHTFRAVAGKMAEAEAAEALLD